MTTITCLVCGAAEEPGADHTCPVCGADLPVASPEDAVTADPTEVPLPADEPTDGAPPADGESLDDEPTDEPLAPSWPPTTSTPPVPPPPPTGAVPPAGGTVGYDPSHPSGIPASMRTYATLTHLSAFAGAIVALAFVGPLVMWLVRRDEHPFLDHHGKEALNFNLSLLLYGVIGIVAAFVTVGIGLVVVIPAAIVFFFTWVITTIVAAVKANNGEGYRYPLTIRFVGEDV